MPIKLPGFGLAGASLGLGQPMLQTITQIVTDDVNHALQNLMLPDINGDASGFSYQGTDVQMLVFNVPLANANVGIAANGGLTFSISNLYAAVGLDWSYREDDWPHISGSGVGWVEINQTSMTFTIDFGVANDRLTANLAADTVNVGAGEMDGFPSEFSLTTTQVAQMIAQAMVTAINTNLNAKLQAMPIQEPVTSTIGVNFALLGAPATAGSFFTLPLLGEGIDLQNPQPFPGNPTVVPPTPSSGQPVQLYMTNYVFDSLLAVFAEQGYFHYVIDKLPPGVPFQLNTSAWAAIIPAFAQAYPAKAFTITVDPLTDPTIAFSSSGGAAAFYGSLTFTVVPDNVVAFVLDLTASADLTFSVSTTLLSANMSDLTASATLGTSKIGNFSLVGFNTILKFVMGGAVGEINKFLNAGHALPVLPAGWTMANPTLAFGPGWLGLACDLSYSIPPEPFVECPNGPGCAELNTCCSNNAGGYGCCPTPAATCCSDGQHCCPHGYACVNGNTQCAPAAPAPGNNQTIPALLRASKLSPATVWKSFFTKA